MTVMKIGYFRNADERDSLAGPMLQLRAAGCTVIHHDTGCGKHAELPGLEAALAALGGGDTLVVCRLADLGRSVAHIIDVLQGLTARGIPFCCLEPPLAVDTLHTPAAWLAHFAEADRILRDERNRRIRTVAGRQGGKIGRPPKVTDTLVAQARALLESGCTVSETAKILGVSRSLLYQQVLPKD